MEVLTRKDRSLTALYLEEPDRVPCIEVLIDPPIIEKITGIHFIRRWEERSTERSEEMAFKNTINIIKACKKIGLDAYTLFESYPPTKWIDELTYIDDWGCIWKYTKSQVTQNELDLTLPQPVEGTIKESEDLEKLEIPDPERERPWLEAAVKEAKEDLLIIPGPYGICEGSWLMRGITGFMMDLYCRPNFVKKLAEKVFKYNLKSGLFFIDMGFEVLMIGDDLADVHGPLISPKLFREFFLPYYQKLIYTWKKKNSNVIILLHSDGNIYPIIDDLINAGIDGFHPIEPQAMSIEYLKFKYGERIALCGNVDCGRTLRYGTPLDVQAEARNIIEAVAHGGGYMLSSSNSILTGTPIENFASMVESARKYGNYPIRG